MLKTLEQYIDGEPAERGLLVALRKKHGRERRMARLLALSVIGHVIFYAVVLQLDTWSLKYRSSRGGPQAVMYKIAELAPPERMADLRTMPEPSSRADISRLEYDPDRADDVNLVPRSPRPARERGNGGRLPSADQIESLARRARPSNATASNTAASARAPQPPAATSVQLNHLPQLNAPVLAQELPARLEPAPPVPQPRLSIDAATSGDQDKPQAGARRGDGRESSALGLQQVQAQYLAYVRARIREANERNMPRDWVKDMLTKKVSADFSVVLRRGGHIQSVDLIRSSGFRVLDGSAREAIYIASPFHGWPQEAGDMLTLTVTVYYTPLW